MVKTIYLISSTTFIDNDINNPIKGKYPEFYVKTKKEAVGAIQKLQDMGDKFHYSQDNPGFLRSYFSYLEIPIYDLLKRDRNSISRIWRFLRYGRLY